MLARFLRPVAGLLLVLALAPVNAAWAHAQTLTTEPADGAILAEAPASLVLRFSEPVTPLAVRLIGPDGAFTELIEAASGGETVTIGLPADLARGTQVLSWRVVSTDGHPIGGSLVFSIGHLTGAVTPPATDPTVAAALWASKALLFLALFVGTGGAAFAVLADLPARTRRVALACALVGLVAAPVSLGLQGLDALGLPLPSFFRGEVWAAGLATSYGATALTVALAFIGAIVVLVLPPGRIAGLLGVAAAGVAALSLALSGHASTAEPQWLTRPAAFLHIGGILFWVGALLPLWDLLRDGSPAADRALARFSRGIPFAVAPLLLSGLALGIIQMGAPGPHWLAPYAAVLAAKLGLLAVLFALALWNRMRLTAPALAADAPARRQLRRSIGIEMLLVVAVLGLVAGWRFTPPPRALAVPVMAAGPIYAHAMDDKAMAMITITPGGTGPVTLDIQLTDLDGFPLDALEVGVTLAAPALGMEPLHREASGEADLWRVEGLTAPLPGVWGLSLDVRLSRFELAKLRGEVDIP